MNIYVNTETENNIESTKSPQYDIDKQCLKHLLDATTIVDNKLIPNTRFRKNNKKLKQSALQ